MALRHTIILACGIMSLVILRCSSLVSETERIRRAYELKNGGTPTVSVTDPVDNSIAPYNQTYVDVTFSTNIDVATFTAQAVFGACSGSFQLSYDGFNNCLGGTVDVSQNPRIRFTPVIFPKALGLQIRITDAVLSTVGIPATPYTSPVGFKLGAPCGNGNCFFSYSTPLMSNAGNYSGVFPVRGGANAGKYLVYTAGISTTTLIDPATATSSDGPDMGAFGCATPGNSTHNFLNNAGTKEVIVRGGSFTETCLFDHALNTFANGPAFLSPIGLGSYSFKPQNPASGEYGNTLVTTANNSASVVRFAANDTATGSVYTLSGGSANLGAHAIRATVGIYTGKWLNFNSGASVTVFTENPPAMSVGYGMGLGVGTAAASFEVFSGMRTGQVVTVFGGNTTNIFAYDIANNAIVPMQPTAMSSAVNAGGLLLRAANTASQDQPLMLHGQGQTTSRYDPASGNFGAGPSSTGAILGGSAAIFIPGGSNGGGFFIVNGQAMSSTSVYFPATNSFSGTRMPRSVPNSGAHVFQIARGPQTGKTMIIAAGGTRHTALYDPISHQMFDGGLTVSNIGTNGFSVPLTQGPQAGKVMVFLGGSALFDFYDADAHQFITPVGWPTSGSINATGAGAISFPVANDPRIVIVRGASTSTTQFLNQDTGAVTAGPVVSCPVNSADRTLRFTNSLGAVKQVVYCGANQVSIFDHATMLFTGSVVLTASGGGGIQMMVIPSGPQAGNVLVIHGNSLQTTTIINRDSLTPSAGPSMVASACAPAGIQDGAQLLQIPYGPNAGKAVLLIGGGSSQSCLYDPATNSFGIGPQVSGGTSPGFQMTIGSVAFRTFGGVYPTSFIVLSGANKNVWSTYVP